VQLTAQVDRPTTGEFGPGQGFGDYEYHEKLATLLGVPAWVCPLNNPPQLPRLTVCGMPGLREWLEKTFTREKLERLCMESRAKHKAA
jgi:hypothetical protein